jgi:hypothetical protein
MVRHSLTDSRPESGTPLDSFPRRWIVADSLRLFQTTNGRRSSNTEFFLRRSMRPARAQAGIPSVRLADVPPPLFARRLQLVLNTLYHVTLPRSGETFHGENMPADQAAFGFDFARMPADGALSAAAVNHGCRLFCTRSAPAATVAHAVVVFSYGRLWLALLLGSASVLLAGLAGTGVAWRTHTPDMFGYVSSMTYNNRFLQLPDHSGGVLDALDRARILQRMRVAATDVGRSNNIGRVAFTNAGFGRGLEKKRMYT